MTYNDIVPESLSRLLFFSLVLSTAFGADLKSKIDELVSKTPAVQSAFTGLEVLRLPSGGVLSERNQDRLFVPAANTKLFTTALALVRLGPEHRFKTQIGADRPIDADGTLAGDLVFAGGGDPSLSGREYPYQYHPDSLAGANYSLRGVEELADQLGSRLEAHPWRHRGRHPAVCLGASSRRWLV